MHLWKITYRIEKLFKNTTEKVNTLFFMSRGCSLIVIPSSLKHF